jgi:hypothetical protein
MSSCGQRIQVVLIREKVAPFMFVRDKIVALFWTFVGSGTVMHGKCVRGVLMSFVPWGTPHVFSGGQLGRVLRPAQSHCIG